MSDNTEITLARDVEAIQIPSGTTLLLAKDTVVVITQSLGGSYTVASKEGLSRIGEKDADALGFEKAADGSFRAKRDPVTPELMADTAGREKLVWEKLKSCFDPEIPVNIVDLGLIYDCVVSPAGDQAGLQAEVKMTLTAPGCGMGPSIAADAEGKILSIPGITEAKVALVWDPPWNQTMISDAGKMKLGIM